MKNSFLKLTAILCLVGTSQAFADSPVWQITKGDRTMYIGGTIHMLVPGDYPLPEAFASAYAASETIVFETDITALQAPEAQQKMLSALSYGEGQSLADDVSPETLKALQTYCAERGIPLEQLLNFKAGMLVSALTVFELQRLGLMGTGVDEFFTRKAKEDQKALGQLETVDEQIEFIADMGKGNEDRFIAYSLKDVQQIPQVVSDMKKAWRVGDLDALKELLLTPMKSDFPSLFKLILTDRNNDWMPDIESMMATPEVEFVMVGALHLPGDVGLLEQLRRKGYTITKQ